MIDYKVLVWFSQKISPFKTDIFLKIIRFVVRIPCTNKPRVLTLNFPLSAKPKNTHISILRTDHAIYVFLINSKSSKRITVVTVWKHNVKPDIKNDTRYKNNQITVLIKSLLSLCSYHTG